MVLQLAVTANQLSLFYGAIVQEAQGNDESSIKKWSTRELFGEKKLVLIEHEGAQYRLMITKQGKLILNK